MDGGLSRIVSGRIWAKQSRAIAAQIGERLRPWIGHREGTFGSLKSLLDRLGASRRQQHVPLTRVRPHPDAQARIQPFVRDLAVELLGEKLYDARTQSTWIDVALKADPVVGRR